MVDYEQKRANRALLSLAIKTAVRVQTAVEVEQEARQMQAREVAFRRLVIAEQQDKGHRNERKKQGKQATAAIDDHSELSVDQKSAMKQVLSVKVKASQMGSKKIARKWQQGLKMQVMLHAVQRKSALDIKKVISIAFLYIFPPHSKIFIHP